MKRWISTVSISALLGFVVADFASAQTGAASDGPWSGWAQCVLTGQFSGQGQTYFQEQTHTWQLTSSTPGPTSTAAIKQYAATWQVTGHGTRQRGQGNNSEQWTTAGPPMPDTITVRVTAEGTVRFGGAAQLRSVGTTTGAAIPYIDEWTFPVIEGAATQTSITGSAPQGVSANFTGAPPGTTSTVTCSWNFVRGGAAPSPPAPQSLSQLGLKPPAPIAVPAPGGTPLPALPGGVLVTGPPQPAPTVAAVPGNLVVSPPSPQPAPAAMPGQVIVTPTPAPTAIGTGREASPIAPSRTATAPPDTATAAPVQATGTLSTTPPATTTAPPKLPLPILTRVTTARGGVTIEWQKPDELKVPYGENGFIVFGPGLPTSGTVVAVTFNQVPCCTLQINNLPAGTQSWLIVPYFSGERTGYGKAFDVNTGLRVTANVAPWSNTPGPSPAGIIVKGFPSPDFIQSSCNVQIVVTWAPVPGAIGYTVLNDGKPLGAPMPFTTFSFYYRQGEMRLSDLVKGMILSAFYELDQSKYSNQPQFVRTVNLSVAAVFPDRADGVKAVDPFTFSTFPCWDGREFPWNP